MRLGPVSEEQCTEPVNSEKLNDVGEPVQLESNDRLSDNREKNTNESSVSPEHDGANTNSGTEKSAISKLESLIKADLTEQISDPFKETAGVENNEIESKNQTENQSSFGELQDGEIFTADRLEEGSDDDVDNDDDDGGGWITPSNIKKMKSKMGMGDSERASVPVGCLTTDFSMQVCLVQ